MVLCTLVKITVDGHQKSQNVFRCAVNLKLRILSELLIERQQFQIHHSLLMGQ